MRARNIKPGFFENEKLAELPALTRILYIGLWCYADREGRFEWRPKRIKAVILPYDDCDIDEMLMSLHVMTFLDMYDTSNGRVGCIPKFKEHQNPHPHEAKSKLPEKSESIQRDDMSLHVSDMSTKCTADSLIPDSLIPDSLIPDNIPASQPDGAKKKKPAKTPAVYSQDFEAFWVAYPARNGQKTKKAKAWDAFWKITTTTDITPEHLTDRIKVLAPQYGDFPRDAVTWLNQRGWEDEVEPIRLQPRKQPQNKAQVLQDQNVAAMNEWLASKGVQG